MGEKEQARRTELGRLLEAEPSETEKAGGWALKLTGMGEGQGALRTGNLPSGGEEGGKHLE